MAWVDEHDSHTDALIALVRTLNQAAEFANKRINSNEEMKGETTAANQAAKLQAAAAKELAKAVVSEKKNLKTLSTGLHRAKRQLKLAETACSKKKALLEQLRMKAVRIEYATAETNRDTQLAKIEISQLDAATTTIREVLQANHTKPGSQLNLRENITQDAITAAKTPMGRSPQGSVLKITTTPGIDSLRAPLPIGESDSEETADFIASTFDLEPAQESEPDESELTYEMMADEMMADEMMTDEMMADEMMTDDVNDDLTDDMTDDLTDDLTADQPTDGMKAKREQLALGGFSVSDNFSVTVSSDDWSVLDSDLLESSKTLTPCPPERPDDRSTPGSGSFAGGGRLSEAPISDVPSFQSTGGGRLSEAPVSDVPSFQSTGGGRLSEAPVSDAPSFQSRLTRKSTKRSAYGDFKRQFRRLWKGKKSSRSKSMDFTRHRSSIHARMLKRKRTKKKL